MNKKILVIHYSQSGQLYEITKSITRPLVKNPNIEVVWEKLQPVKPYPFPWPIYRFFDVMPESVLMEPPEMLPFSFRPEMKFDLILLAYQVWFFAPSLPVTGFLKHPAAQVMKDVPVITIVNCRDKWLMAQERVKDLCKQAGGKLIDNVVFIHQGNALIALITTLRWLWWGKKEGFWKIFPPAGVSLPEIQDAERFGKAIESAIETEEIKKKHPILTGLGAVKVGPDIIQQEKAAYRIFIFWAKFLRSVGKQGELKRAPILALFFLSLFCLILLSIPLAVPFKLFINPFKKEDLQKEIDYYEQPSGSSTERFNRGEI